MSSVNFLFFIFGITISVPLLIFGTSYFSDNVTLLAVITLSAVILSVFISIIIVSNRDKILKKIYRTAKVDTDEIVTTVQHLVKNLLDKNYAKSLECSDQLVRNISARYTWLTTRKWMIGVIVSILAVFVGLAGSALIFKQNSLLSEHGDILSKQNKLIQIQIREKLLEKNSFIYQENNKNFLVALDSCAPLYNRGKLKGKFTYIDINKFLKFFDTMGSYVDEKLISLETANKQFGWYLLTMYHNNNGEIQQYIKDTRKNSSKILYSDLISLVEEVIALQSNKVTIDKIKDICRKVKEKKNG